MSLGFQSGAFQRGAFQSEDAAAPAQQRFVPGHKRHDRSGYAPPGRRYRTEEEILERRYALGIIPRPVEKVVEKAAAKVIAKARAAQDATPTPDVLGWLQQHHAQQSAILAADLRKRHIEASLQEQRTYMILLAIEVEKRLIQDAEYEQIAMLMMEM